MHERLAQQNPPPGATPRRPSLRYTDGMTSNDEPEPISLLVFSDFV
jgi:hypothetical protein